MIQESARVRSRRIDVLSSRRAGSNIRSPLEDLLRADDDAFGEVVLIEDERPTSRAARMSGDDAAVGGALFDERLALGFVAELLDAPFERSGAAVLVLFAQLPPVDEGEDDNADEHRTADPFG